MNSIMKYISLAALPILLISCSKDYLETVPTDRVSSGQIFSTLKDAKTAINGIYRFMFTRTNLIATNVQNKPGVGGIMLAMDFMGEDLGIGSSTWFTSTGEGNWVGHRSETANELMEYDYRTFYKIIGDANFVLDYVADINASEEERNALRVQALTLRAYAYSYLVQIYGKRYDRATDNSQLAVPLVLKSTDGALPQSTVKEVYAIIVKDLDEAITLDVSDRENKSYANSEVALGLRARVALTMQDYDNAILYAKKLIDLSEYSLMNQEECLKGFNDAEALSEFIWASMPSSDQGDIFGSFFAQIAYNANTSFMRTNPKRINSALYEQIPTTDIRSKMWEPVPTAENFPLPLPTYARQPYMSRKFSVKAAGNTLGDVPLMRLAEMYLIAAEGYAGKTQDGLAQDILHELVKVRDVEAQKSTKTGAELLEEIWMQRRIELWGEGFRFLDLKRQNQPLNRSAVPNYVSNSVNGLMDVPAGDKRWEFLFPRAELDANPNIIQNEK